MAIEDRNGKLYLYRKRREGDRVISEYVGGSVVDLMTYQAEKEQRERMRAAFASIALIDAELDRACAMVDEIVSQSLIAAGYHQHKRQWRKKRNVGNKETQAGR